MTRRRRRDVIPFLGLCWLAVGLAVGARAEGTKRPITAKDLMRFTWAADPRIAPDGSRVAFVKVAVDADKDDYLTSIWLVPVPARGRASRAAAADQRPARHRAPMVARRDPLDLRPGHREGREAAAAPALPAVVRRGRAPAADRPAQRGLVAGLVARWQDRRLPERDHARRPRQGPARQEGGETGARERRPDRHAGRIPPR